MLERIAVDQVRRIAGLARAARNVRDQMLAQVGEPELGAPGVAARGLHDPAAEFGLDPLPPDHPARAALNDAITARPREAQDELRALVLVGRGDLGANEWQRALTEAAGGHGAPVPFLTSDASLHEHLERASTS